MSEKMAGIRHFHPNAMDSRGNISVGGRNTEDNLSEGEILEHPMSTAVYSCASLEFSLILGSLMCACGQLDRFQFWHFVI